MDNGLLYHRRPSEVIRKKARSGRPSIAATKDVERSSLGIMDVI